MCFGVVFFSSRRRHTRGALVTGVQTCALPICAARDQVTRDYGMKRMVTAAGGGQIVEPTGMNYVGTGPSWSRTVVEELLPRIFAKSRKIAFIEWHTGLGGYG